MWSRLEVPQVRQERYDDQLRRTVWQDLPGKEWQPHRPDAFFTLYFPGNSGFLVRSTGYEPGLPEGNRSFGFRRHGSEH